MSLSRLTFSRAFTLPSSHWVAHGVSASFRFVSPSLKALDGSDWLQYLPRPLWYSCYLEPFQKLQEGSRLLK